MSKKPINFKAPTEVVQLLDNAAGDATRSMFSIKLLRTFFNENPPLRDMSGVLAQDVSAFTLRLPEDLVEQLDVFAERHAYNRHTALIVALLAALGHRGFTTRPVIQLGT